MRNIAGCLTVAGLLLGLLHVGLTMPIYRSLSLEALWFAGSGLAITGASLLNFVALRNQHLSGLWLVMVCNVLIAGFFAAAWPLLPGPQTVAGLCVFAVLAGYFGMESVRQSSVQTPSRTVR